ncbi:biotin transporter BioY [Propionispora hippei]|uniref:Biotin transporter n=1 Tax=Propionispora hippei DSM 15287 TaxID=1123003 RepID=A0A1M6IKH3_9FIRM|nr:biotin transporter BioY [Propionispora hippei]SHJ35012.1 biotin transport system substrate-specific component [Propionispora hippei DSM 15287]
MNKNKLTDFIYAAMFAALISVLGFLSIPLPFSPVPVTGQSLGVMLAGSILTARQANMALFTFLLLGIAGVPVFAGGTAGVGILLGPRGGYLLGFWAAAILIALMRRQNGKLWHLALANIAGGIGLVYILGVCWLSTITGMPLAKAITVGALPYIPGDLFKVVIATLVGSAVARHLPGTKATS